jgi:CheY-like chemotaxis protein
MAGATREKSVLIVEDDPGTGELLTQVLRDDLGIRCHWARHGTEALRLAAEQRPDLILLDMRLHDGMEGFELCRRLKADHRTEPIPVVAVSALAREEERLRALQIGCAEWLAKPFDLDDLISCLERYLTDPIGGGAPPTDWARRWPADDSTRGRRARVEAMYEEVMAIRGRARHVTTQANRLRGMLAAGRTRRVIDREGGAGTPLGEGQPPC